MIGPQDDLDDINEGKPAGEGTPPGGTKTVGGVDLGGLFAAFRQEGPDRYRGLITAAMERAGWAMRSGTAAVVSRFFQMVGGVVSETGLEPVANQSPVGTGQRGLVTPSGAWWVQFVLDAANWVSERNAIVGEDARAVPLQRLMVGKEITKGVWLAGGATARTISAFDTAYASLVTTEPMHIDRAKQQTFRVAYTPGVTGSRPLLYPQFTQGETPEVWHWLEAEQDAFTPFGGIADPPTQAIESMGFVAKDPFAQRGTLGVGVSYVSTFMLAPSDRFPACRAIRFAARDTDLATPGAISIWGTQE